MGLSYLLDERFSEPTSPIRPKTRFGCYLPRSRASFRCPEVRPLKGATEHE